MARITALLLVIGALLAGCAGSFGIPSESENKAEQAKNIFPENYKSDLLAAMRTYLNNPENVRNAALSPPQRLPTGSPRPYVACLRFNAKNSAGKYVGSKDTLAIFLSGKFDRLVELGRTGATPEDTARNKVLRDFCANAAYQPFPELEQLRR